MDGACRCMWVVCVACSSCIGRVEVSVDAKRVACMYVKTNHMGVVRFVAAYCRQYQDSNVGPLACCALRDDSSVSEMFW